MNLVLKALDKLAEIAVTRPEERQARSEGLVFPDPIYTPAAHGRFRYWQHTCGHIAAFAIDHPPELAVDCDRCSQASEPVRAAFASDDPEDWSQLYVRAA